MSAVNTVPITRSVPPLGGFNLTMLRIELRRILRNRRAVIFTLVMPVVLYLIIGTNGQYTKDAEGSGNVSAYILISMAVAPWSRPSGRWAGRGSCA